MNAKPIRCIRCHPPAPGDIPNVAPFNPICDLCMQELNHPRPYPPLHGESPTSLSRKAQQPRKRPQAGASTRKRKPRQPKGATVALILFLLALASGCALHRQSTLDWGSLHYESTLEAECDPRDLLTLEAPKPTES